MKLFKRFSVVIILSMLLSLLFATNAFAGVYTQDYVTVGVGSSVTITVSSGDCTGKYYVNSSSGCVTAYNSGDGWLEPGENGYVTIVGNSIGTGTVEIGYVVSDLSYKDIEGVLTVSVNVVENTSDGGDEQPKEEETSLGVTIGDVKYKILADLSEIKLPEGFTKADGTYGTEKVNVAKYVTTDNVEIILYALSPKEGGEVVFMTYDVDKKEFKEPKMIKQGKNTYYLLNIPSSFKVPDNYQIKEIALGDITHNAILSKDIKNTEFVYVYALLNGKEGFYSYDTVENTIQRCTDLESIINPKTEVKETKNSVNKTMVIVIGVAALAVVIMGIFLIILIAKRRKDRNYEDDELFAFNEMDDEDDFDIPEESNESEDLDELDVIDLSVDSIEDNEPDETDKLDLIDLTKKSKDIEND